MVETSRHFWERKKTRPCFIQRCYVGQQRRRVPRERPRRLWVGRPDAQALGRWHGRLPDDVEGAHEFGAAPQRPRLRSATPWIIFVYFCGVILHHGCVDEGGGDRLCRSCLW